MFWQKPDSISTKNWAEMYPEFNFWDLGLFKK
jgi:hypothetical protein